MIWSALKALKKLSKSPGYTNVLKYLADYTEEVYVG